MKKDLLQLDIYELTQAELIDYITTVLSEQKIPFSQYEGNIYSFRHFGKPVFVAHMDTVKDEDMSKPLLIDPMSRTLKRQDGILGADDRAGCALLLNHIHEINFLFTVDEEKGGHGSYALTTNEDWVSEVRDAECTCFVQFDRRGFGQVIGTLSDYCCEDLEQEIGKAIGFVPTRGVYTDINNLREVLPGVNLSIGYYNEHTHNEYLNIDEFFEVNNYVPILNEALAFKVFESPSVDPYEYEIPPLSRDELLLIGFDEDEIDWFAGHTGGRYGF